MFNRSTIVALAGNIIIYALQNFAPMKINELRDELFRQYEEGLVLDEELVQIFELIASYLNLKTITNYAKANGISYNGALKRKLHKIEIDKITFIIDND